MYVQAIRAALPAYEALLEGKDAIIKKPFKFPVFALCRVAPTYLAITV
jgi:hypothetical protein